MKMIFGKDKENYQQMKRELEALRVKFKTAEEERTAAEEGKTTLEVRLQEEQNAYKARQDAWNKKMGEKKMEMEQLKDRLKGLAEATPRQGPYRILIVEDSERHLATVEDLRKEGHTVDVARNLAEALESLFGNKQYKYCDISNDPSHDILPPSPDAVLTDLNFTSGGYGGASRDNSEQPLGYAVALAAMSRHVPYVAIVTDQDHHSNAVAASFDLFKTEESVITTFFKRPDGSDGRFYFGKKIMQFGPTRLVLLDIRDLRPDLYLTPDGTVTQNYEHAKGYQQIKNLPEALERLVKG